MMLVAIDFDQTWAAQPELMDRIAATFIEQGHTVICVTQLRDCQESWDIVLGCRVRPVKTYFTGNAPKAWYLAKRGIQVDVWIDATPETIGQSRKWMEELEVSGRV